MAKKKGIMETKKLNIGDLIKNAEKIKSRKLETKELYIKSQDAKITIAKPDRELITDSYDMDDNSGELYLVYESIIDPNVKDEELQKAYGVKGYDILDEIFEPGEITAISKEIARFGGYGDSVEEIKN